VTTKREAVSGFRTHGIVEAALCRFYGRSYGRQICRLFPPSGDSGVLYSGDPLDIAKLFGGQ
jgi:hypothetical protein